MPNPAYLVTNLLSVAVTFTSSTIDAIYGYQYLYDGKQNIPFRWTNNTTQWILLDFGAPVTADVMAAINHNWTSAAVVFISAGSTNLTADFTQVLTWADKNMYGQFASQTWRYWRIDVTNPTNPDQIQLGELMLGDAITLSRHFSYGVQEAEDFVNDEHTTERGNVTAYEGYQQESRIFPASNILPTVRAEIRAMYRATKGRLLPLFFMPNIPDNLESFFCRLGPRYSASLTAKTAQGYAYQSSVDLREEARGASVT